MSMIKLMKNLLYCFLLLLFYSSTLLLFSKHTFAQEASSPMGATDVNLHSWTQISSLDVASSLVCQIMGFDPAKPEGAGCVFYGQEGNLQVMNKAGGGAVAFTGNLIASLYTNPPASGVRYLADLGKNLGIGKPAYAAVGTGFSGLSPIMPIWRAFRNVAYLFFTIIFIVIGFAIMFRVKISPQAVVTIQAALPRIVIALILVTFSYAIAGFLIDLMYVLILLAVAFLGKAGVPSIGPDDIKGLQSQFTGSFLGTIQGVYQVISWQLPTAFVALGAVIGGIIGGIIGHFAAMVGTLPGMALGAAGGAILFVLILSVIVLYLIFKLFIELLKAYISIIMGVIFGPLQIMLGAIPGQSGFGSWFKNLLANILVFPAVAIFLLIARSLMSLAGESFWTPPMFSFPSQILPAILALGVLFMVTKIPEMIKDAFQIKPFKYGAAIGEAMGAPGRVAGYGIRGVSIATDMGRAWTTRFGTRTQNPPPAGGGGVPEEQQG